MVLVMSKTPLGFFNHNLAGFGDVYTNVFFSLRGISRFLLTPLGIRRSPSTAATYWSDTHGRCAPTTEGTFSHSKFWKQAKCLQGGGHFALQKGRSFISIYMHLQNAGHLKHLFAFFWCAFLRRFSSSSFPLVSNGIRVRVIWCIMMHIPADPKGSRRIRAT